MDTSKSLAVPLVRRNLFGGCTELSKRRGGVMMVPFHNQGGDAKALGGALLLTLDSSGSYSCLLARLTMQIVCLLRQLGARVRFKTLALWSAC